MEFCTGLLAVAGRSPVILVTLFAGIGCSPASKVLAESGIPQHSLEKKLCFLAFGFEVGEEVVGLVFAVGPAAAPVCVIDILLLAVLPFLFRPNELAFDSLDPPPMLSLRSAAVAPLSLVEVGEGWFRDDDLEGTFKRPRFFCGTSSVPSSARAASFSFSESTMMGDSEISVEIVLCAVEDV